MGRWTWGLKGRFMRATIIMVLMAFLAEILAPGIALGAQAAPGLAKDAVRGFRVMGKTAAQTGRSLKAAGKKSPSPGRLLAQVLNIDGGTPVNAGATPSSPAPSPTPQPKRPRPKNPKAPSFAPVTFGPARVTARPKPMSDKQFQEKMGKSYIVEVTINGKHIKAEKAPGVEEPKVKVESVNPLLGLQASRTTLPALESTHQLLALGEITSAYYQTPYSFYQETSGSERSLGDGSETMEGYGGSSWVRRFQHIPWAAPTQISQTKVTKAIMVLHSPDSNDNMQFTVNGQNYQAVQVDECIYTMTLTSYENGQYLWNWDVLWKVYDQDSPNGYQFFTTQGTTSNGSNNLEGYEEPNTQLFRWGWRGGNWDLDLFVTDNFGRNESRNHDLGMHGWDVDHSANPPVFDPSFPDPNYNYTTLRHVGNAQTPTWTLNNPQGWAKLWNTAPPYATVRTLNGTATSGSSVTWEVNWDGKDEDENVVTPGRWYGCSVGLEGSITGSLLAGNASLINSFGVFVGNVNFGTVLSPNPMEFVQDENGHLTGTSDLIVDVTTHPDPPAWVLQNPTWQINVKDAQGNTVRTQNGSLPDNEDTSFQINWTWDGRDGAGNVCVGDYTYDLILECDQDVSWELVSSPLTVLPPMSIDEVQVSPLTAYVDNGDQELNVDFNLIGGFMDEPLWKIKDPMYVLELRKLNGDPVVVGDPVQVTAENETVHIQDTISLLVNGEPIPAGLYRVNVYAQAAQGQIQEADSAIVEVGSNHGMNGNYHFEETDLTWPSRALSVVVGRSYDTRNAFADAYKGWRFNFSGLSVRPDQSVNIKLPGGGQDRFTRDTSGNYVPARGDMTSTLVKNIDDTYALTSKHGIVQYYDTEGRLDRIVDQSSNEVKFNYDAQGHLSSIRDPLMHEISVTQTQGANGSWRITRLTDPAGRYVDYTYDAEGGLSP